MKNVLLLIAATKKSFFCTDKNFLRAVVILFIIPHLVTAQFQEIEENDNIGQWNKNIVLINQQLAKAKTSKKYLLVTELTILKAKQFYMKSSHQNYTQDSVYAVLTKAKLLSNRNGSIQVQSDILHLTGQLEYSKAFENGRFLESRVYFEKALTLRRQVNDPRGISESLFYIGLTYEQREHTDSAKIFYSEAYEIALKNQLNIEQSFAARHLGSVHETLNHKVEALAYYEESLQKRIDAKHCVGVPYALILLADFHKKENFRKADSLYQEADKVAGFCNVWRAQVNALNSLGELNENDCEKSIPYFRKALERSATFNYISGENRAKAGILKCSN